MIWFVFWLIVLAVGIFAEEDSTLKKVCLFVTLVPIAVCAFGIFILWGLNGFKV